MACADFLLIHGESFDANGLAHAVVSQPLRLHFRNRDEMEL